MVVKLFDNLNIMEYHEDTIYNINIPYGQSSAKLPVIQSFSHSVILSFCHTVIL